MGIVILVSSGITKLTDKEPIPMPTGMFMLASLGITYLTDTEPSPIPTAGPKTGYGEIMSL